MSMSAADRRKAMKREMRQRQEESVSRKDDSGKFKKIYVEGLKKDDFWKSEEGEHSLDIIPYIAGANNPHVKEGKPAYILDVFVHRKIGVNEDDYICLSRTYNEDCPICEYQNELRKAAKNSDDPESYDEEIKSLNPTRRAIYNVRSWDKKDDPDDVKIFDVSHFLFEKELLEAAKKKRGGGFVLFADPDEGKIVSFRQVGKLQAMTFKAFEFEERKEVIPDEILDKSRCLDELIHIPTYEEVMRAFAGRGEVEEVKEERSARSHKEPDPEPEPEKPKGGDRRYKLDEDKKMPPKKEEPEDVPEPGDECPYEYIFGSDNNKFDECEGCDCFDECGDKFRELRAAARAKREAPAPKEEPKEEKSNPPRRRRAS